MKCFWAFSTFAIGGPQRRFATLVKALGPDWTHAVAAMDGRYDAETLLEGAANHSRCDVSVEKGGFLSSRNARVFADALRAAAPDLLLTSNWGTIEWRLANRSTKIPHVHFEDGFSPDEALGRRSWRRDLARRILFSRAATGHDAYGFVAPSSQICRLLQRAWGAPCGRVHLVPNGVDIASFAHAQTDETTGSLIAGSVGALRPEKRFDRMIRIFDVARAETDARLLIVGGGPDMQALQDEAARRDLQAAVKFVGAQQDVAPFLAKMDVYMITSDTEQMPISLVEAMAAGLPVVGVDVGDVKQMVSMRNQPFIHPPGDEAAAARSLATLLGDATLRTSIGLDNAAKAAAEFTEHRMVARYRDLFHAIKQMG